MISSTDREHAWGDLSVREDRPISVFVCCNAQDYIYSPVREDRPILGKVSTSEYTARNKICSPQSSRAVMHKTEGLNYERERS